MCVLNSLFLSLAGSGISLLLSHRSGGAGWSESGCKITTFCAHSQIFHTKSTPFVHTRVVIVQFWVFLSDPMGMIQEQVKGIMCSLFIPCAVNQPC